jgi:hypothetical protein
MSLHFDVAVSPRLSYSTVCLLFNTQKCLHEDCEAFKLTNIYGNPAREHYLIAFIKRQCSSIQNSFHKLVCTTLIISIGFSTNRPQFRSVTVSLVMTPVHSQTHI